MRILIAVVHFWDPEGGGRHQSLCADPYPRVAALQQLILSLRRLSQNQSLLDIASRSVGPCNELFRHEITICLVTDGHHHVIDHLSREFGGSFKFIAAQPVSPRHLGFEAQRFLELCLDDNYDLYGYIEDDLVIHDSLFFDKIFHFQQHFGCDNLLLPHRIEFESVPHIVDRFYIDGPIDLDELAKVIPDPSPPLVYKCLGNDVEFVSPANPHSGCFFLTHDQLSRWVNHVSWQDGDDSWVSPLESAATLGISKVFQLYKPSFECGGWLELQHWGQSFLCKLRHPSTGSHTLSSGSFSSASDVNIRDLD